MTFIRAFSFMILLGLVALLPKTQAQTYEIADSLWDEGIIAEEDGKILRAAQLFEQSAEAELNCELPREEDLYYALRSASYNYHQVNMLDKALELRKRSLQKSIQVFGKDHENYGLEAGWVGGYYKMLEQYDQALTLYLEALEYAEKSLGKDHIGYGTRLHNLAELYQSMDQYDESLPLYYEALENVGKNLGKEHSSYGLVLNNLAFLYQSMGEYEKALPLFLQALENAENSLGKNHPHYGTRLNNLALFYQKMGQYEKALPLLLQALENTKSSLGKEHPDYGERLNNLAELFRTMGQYDQALPLYLEALENTENALSKEHPDYGMSLNNLALLYKELGQYDKALSLYLEALKSTEKSLGRDHPSYGSVLNNLAELHRTMSQHEEALPLYIEALENTQKTLGKDHPNYGNHLNNLASLYTNMAQYDQALSLYLEALENTEKSVGTDHPDYGTSLNNLAGLYDDMGLYEKALPFYLQALENTENSLGKNHPAYGTVLSNLAGLYQTMGQYDQALPLQIEALEITEISLGKDHPGYGIRLNNLAVLYRRMGQYEKALPLYLEALKITENALGKEHPDYSIRLNQLAELYKTLGQYDRALPLYFESLGITENSLGKEHPDYGTRLNNLASLHADIGQYDQALPLFLKAFEITENTLGKDHPDYGTRLNNLAGLYEDMGQYEKALSLYLEAMENTEKNLGKKHPDYGLILNNLASLYENMSQHEKAISLYLEALHNTKNALSTDQSDYGIWLNNLALLHQEMGQWDQALPLFLEGQRLSLSLLERNFSFLSEREQEQYATTLNYNFKAYHSFYTRYSAQDPRVASHAYDIELATKGMILQSGINMRRAILSSGDPQALDLFDEWSLHKSILAREYSKPIAERRDDLGDLEQTTQRIEAELRRASQTFSKAQNIGSTSWQDIQRQLQPDEVAIEFSSFQFHNNHSWTDSTLYTAIILRPDDEHPHLVPLFEQSQLDSLLARKGTSDIDFVSGLYRTLSRDAQTVHYGAQLYDLIWRPLEDYLHPGERIYFAPSGSLHQIAFAAIPAGEDTLLSDRYQLHQLSTTARLLEESRVTAPLPSNITLYGGIDYDLDPGQLPTHEAIPNEYDYVSRSLPGDLNRGETWEYLPGTLAEVQAIESLAETAGISASIATGAQATEVAYKMQSGNTSPHVLHIATHGFFFPDPEAKAPDERALLTGETQVFRSSENPLQRSGILFAGANRAWSGQTLPEQVEDGILTAYEVANVMLGNTRLVVLSACETGLGDIRGSEGVFGLQRAFKAAGAEYLLMSLWKVPDKETAEFMSYFYEHWFSGATIDQSFHATQTHMKQLYPDDPYKWAAFVLLL